jgi:hypothetical protein
MLFMSWSEWKQLSFIKLLLPNYIQSC